MQRAGGCGDWEGQQILRVAVSALLVSPPSSSFSPPLFLNPGSFLFCMNETCSSNIRGGCIGALTCQSARSAAISLCRNLNETLPLEPGKHEYE